MNGAVDVSFQTLFAKRSDYGSQFEILVALLYFGIVKPGDTVVDGGANAGLHAYPLAKTVGENGLLIAFEPIPRVFADLERNVAGWKTELHRAALAERAGHAAFVVVDENPALSHLQHPYDEPKVGQQKISVPLVTLDDTIGERNISFIKLDLEGADFRALRGAEKLLTRTRAPVIFENSRAWAAECNAYSKDDFFAFFETVRYDVFDLHGTKLTPANWTAENVAYEFIAVAREKAAQRDAALWTIRYFWENESARPELKNWVDCVHAVGDIDRYMSAYHHANWRAPPSGAE